jgi:hypothetical protein
MPLCRLAPERLDVAQRFGNGALRSQHVETGLEIERELSRRAEKFCEPQRRIGTDAELLARNPFDAGTGHAARFRNSVGRQPERLDKLLAQHLAGMIGG